MYMDAWSIDIYIYIYVCEVQTLRAHIFVEKPEEKEKKKRTLGVVTVIAESEEILSSIYRESPPHSLSLFGNFWSCCPLKRKQKKQEKGYVLVINDADLNHS